MEFETRFCTSSDGTRIAYTTFGEPADQPLVVVRNFDSAQEFAWNEPGAQDYYEMLASGRRLVTFDRRGVGSSQRDVDDVTILTQVGDVAAVVDELALETFDLMAASHAAALAAAYAVEYPERVDRLVLRNPVVRTSGPPFAGYHDTAQSIRANWSFARRMMATFAHPDGPTELQRWYANALRDSVAPEVAARHTEVVAEFNGSETFGSVQASTLVLGHSGAHESHIAAFRSVASLIPDARLVTYDYNSATRTEDNRQVVTCIQQFLDEGRVTPDRDAVPSQGTAVILFLDIADSTALTSQLGDSAYREKESALDASLRSAITEAGGTPVEGKVLGDGIMSVFKSARQAIEAAERCRDLGNQAGLLLHLGIHAGDVVREGNNVHGGAVQVAARVQSVAAPGEILVSATVRDLARTSANVQFEERGEHELKGIPEPQRLFAVREQD